MSSTNYPFWEVSGKSSPLHGTILAGFVGWGIWLKLWSYPAPAVNPFSQVSTVHHAASHVFAVARITLHHHGCWFEDRHSDLSHWQLLMISFLRRDDWCIGGQHEVNSRIWHQIRLEPWILKKRPTKITSPKELGIFLPISKQIACFLEKKQWICRYKPLPPEVEYSPEKVPFPIGKACLPTIIFQGRTLKLRVYFKMMSSHIIQPWQDKGWTSAPYFLVAFIGSCGWRGPTLELAKCDSGIKLSTSTGWLDRSHPYCFQGFHWTLAVIDIWFTVIEPIVDEKCLKFYYP